MPQLPKVAVVGDDALADAVCAALVDGGLEAVRVTGSAASSAFEATVTVGGTWTWTGTGTGTGNPAGEGESPPRFGGVFEPGRDGSYTVGRRPPGPLTTHGDEVALAQARWLGEYLRGRYLLPERSEMLAHPGLRPVSAFFTWSGRGSSASTYLKRLARELRRGRARAAAAGYPLPVPSTAADRLPDSVP